MKARWNCWFIKQAKRIFSGSQFLESLIMPAQRFIRDFFLFGRQALFFFCCNIPEFLLRMAHTGIIWISCYIRIVSANIQRLFGVVMNQSNFRSPQSSQRTQSVATEFFAPLKHRPRLSFGAPILPTTHPLTHTAPPPHDSPLLSFSSAPSVKESSQAGIFSKRYSAGFKLGAMHQWLFIWR